MTVGSVRAYRVLRIPAALLVFSLAVSVPVLVGQAAPSRGGPQGAIAEGVQLLRGGKAVEAKTKFDAAIRLAPRSTEALTWRGICENGMGDFAAAEQDFQAALQIDPTILSAHYNLALSLIRLKKTDGAIAQLRLVVAAQPTAVQPRYNLAVLLEGKGETEDAAKELAEAYRLAPDDVGVTLHLLVDSLKLKQLQRVQDFVAVLRGDAATPAMQREAGAALLEAGRFSAAAALLEHARGREPGVGGVDLLLARAELGEGRNADAIALLEAGPAGASDEDRTYLLALAYTGTGDRAKAVEGFQAAARMDPKDARPLYHLGLLAATAADGGVASVRLLREAVRMDPETVAYPLTLARVLLATDQAEEAKAVLAKVPVAEGGAERPALLGIALAATNGVAQAVPLLEKAIHDAPEVALSQSVLGFCLFRQGQYGPAAVAYRRAAELEPKRLLYLRDAALAYQRADKSEAALEFAERAAALPGAGAGDHALLGKLYAAAGRRDDAIRELRQATAMDPELDAPVYLLARTYQQMGDPTQAAAWSAKLGVLKQQHAAAFNLEKKAGATAIRSSTLLEGGSLKNEDEGVQ